MNRDLGDFQTPPELVARIIKACVGGRHWTRLLEPTCGTGAFITGALAAPRPPQEVWGIDLQEGHLRQARAVSRTRARVHLRNDNIFFLDLQRDLAWETSGPLLVLGNPPWVTNAELGRLGSGNVPKKANFKNVRGIEALTGGSNFDIAEYIWLKLIKELAPQRPTIALLCKTAVARNVLLFAERARLSISSATIRRIDTHRYFHAAVDACLFSVEVGASRTSYEAAVYDDLEANTPSSTIGVVRGQLVANLQKYTAAAFADGRSPLAWRQGVKHDAADVMELTPKDGFYVNKLGDLVDVEPAHLYQLLKSSDLNAATPPRFSVIVTQTTLGEDTNLLRNTAPRLWLYLMQHRERFANRKSSIYRRRGPFAMFGIGEYSFAPYKVAISGLYKRPFFRLVPPSSGRPLMLDDTCYFVPFSSAGEASLVTALLNHPASIALVESLVFWDSKRPITKALLQRLDLLALISCVPQDVLVTRAAEYLRGTPDARQNVQWETVLEKMVDHWRRGADTNQMLLLEAEPPDGLLMHSE